MHRGEHHGELTWRALALGLFLAVVLGAANAYLGLKAGMTVAATFPAAVIAIAAFRLPWVRGTVLEQNIARTTAAVGEALVAAAIFTLPALVMAEVDGQPIWDHFHYWESVAILGAGGLLGLLFIILLRRGLTVDAGLPFPESVACFDLVRAGQGQDAGARFVFGASALGMLLELCKNANGFALYKESTSWHLPIAPGTWMQLQSPLISPALLSVGFIIGPQFAGLTALGSAIAWLGIVPALMFFHTPDVVQNLSTAELSYYFWEHHLRPIAIGTMLIASLYTLWGLRHSIVQAMRGAMRTPTSSAPSDPNPRERDIPSRACIIAAACITAPLALIYWHYAQSLTATVFMAAVLFTLTFFLSIIGAWLVGLVGSSNQPVSGVTLTSIGIVGLLLLGMGIGGSAGVAVTLITAVIICAAAALSGTLIQELKVGQMLGATPWKMQTAQLIGTLVVAFVCVTPMMVLHESALAQAIANGLPAQGIGGPGLPAPQASLMAQVTTAILGGTIAWDMIAIGALLGLLMIAMRVTGPMVIAVGMYLSIETTLAILLGGMCKWWLDRRAAVRGAQEHAHSARRGTLLASGLIAGEALAGVLIAGITLIWLRYQEQSIALSELLHMDFLPKIGAQWGVPLSGLALLGIVWVLVGLPLKNRSRS